MERSSDSDSDRDDDGQSGFERGLGELDALALGEEFEFFDADFALISEVSLHQFLVLSFLELEASLLDHPFQLLDRNAIGLPIFLRVKQFRQKQFILLFRVSLLVPLLHIFLVAFTPPHLPSFRKTPFLSD